MLNDKECHVGVKGVKYAAEVHERMTRRNGSPIDYTNRVGHRYVSLPMRKIAQEVLCEDRYQLNQKYGN